MGKNFEDKNDMADNVKGAMKRDWEQTKNDVGIDGTDLDQDVDDTLRQAAGKETPVDPSFEKNRK